jgi:hypothetical protein
LHQGSKLQLPGHVGLIAFTQGRESDQATAVSQRWTPGEGAEHPAWRARCRLAVAGVLENGSVGSQVSPGYTSSSLDFRLVSVTSVFPGPPLV